METQDLITNFFGEIKLFGWKTQDPILLLANLEDNAIDTFNKGLQGAL